MNSFLDEHPNANDKEIHKQILNDYENKIYYRAISPRIFEAAIFRNLMILFEGKYQSVIEPDRHYIELKKDFSNIEEVIKKAQDPQVYREITDRAYNDLILSEKYSYRLFIEDFCNKIGIKSVDKGTTNKNKVLVYPKTTRIIFLRIYFWLSSFSKNDFYGKQQLRKIFHRLIDINQKTFND